MYTLGGGISVERGWGREGETFTVKDELAAYGVEPTWFGLGDKDIATHLIRTQSLNAGFPLSEITTALCEHWQPGVRLIPMTDDRAETNVIIEDEQGRRAIHFQEWWIKYRASIPAQGFVLVGVDQASPAPGVLEAIESGISPIVLMVDGVPLGLSEELLRAARMHGVTIIGHGRSDRVAVFHGGAMVCVSPARSAATAAAAHPVRCGSPSPRARRWPTRCGCSCPTSCDCSRDRSMAAGR
jgi:hypothetical protein